MSRFCIIMLLFSLGPASAAIEDKYYRLNSFNFGAFVIKDAHVSLVAVPRTGKAVEQVKLLQLDHGVISVRPTGDATSLEELHASIAQGTDKDPAASLSGSFEWKNGVLVRFTLDSLHLRLRGATSTSTLFGGKLTVDANSSTFIDNATPIVVISGKSESHLALKIFGSQVESPHISLQRVPIVTTLTSTSTKANLLTIDLATGQLNAENAIYSAATGDSSTQVTDTVFLEDRITGGHLSIEGLQLSVEQGVSSLTIAAVHISHPIIQVKGYENLPVAEAEEYLARNVASNVPAGADLRFDSASAADTYATANPWGVVNQLNNLSVFAPDVLIPTGSPDLRYIRPSDLGKLYSIFGNAGEKAHTVTGVLIQQKDGVVSKVVVDFGQAPSIKDGIPQQHPVCFLVETLTGLAAGAAVDALFAEVPLYAATNAWLRVTDPLNPRFAVPSFVTTYAVSKGTIKLFGEGFNYKGLGFDGMAAAVAGGVAAEYCELLVAKLPNRVVFTRPNYLVRPYLFETIQMSPGVLLADDIAIHHQLYLGKAVRVDQLMKNPAIRPLIQGQERQAGTLNEYNDAVLTLEARAHEGLSAQVLEAQKRDNQSSQERAAAEGLNLSVSAATARLSASQRATDEAAAKAKENVTKSDPNSHVPGPEQPTPQPPPTSGQPVDRCPGGVPCPVITTTPRGGHQ